MTVGFIKLHRQIKDHWVASRPDWFQAWLFILMSANYETGQVNLTEVYRELSRHFTSSMWRRFIERLAKDEMLSDVETQNLGLRQGFRQVATVTNWRKYHQANTVSFGRALGGAQAEHLAETNKNTSKEVKEEKPITSPKGDDEVYESFKALWNQGKPERSPTLADNSEVRKRARTELKRLGRDELLRRAAAALVFVRADRFSSETRPCTPITLLRHLDTYAEQGQTRTQQPKRAKPRHLTAQQIIDEARRKAGI